MDQTTIKQAIKTQAQRELARLSFLDFFRMFWVTVVQDDLVENWHIETICSELQELGERVIKRQPKTHDLIINVPPGESKSTICTVLFPVWLWCRDPSLRIITGSYASALSTAHAVKSRDALKSSIFGRLFPEVELRKDLDAKSYYANTSGGERLAVSTGSAVTGMHGHILIIDDPLNPKQAASAAELEACNRWFFETLPTRKVDKAVVPTILIMQRLAENDPTGLWLQRAGAGVRHICIPGELCETVAPVSLRERYQDGIMNQKRNNRRALDELRTALGSRAYAAQVLQTPSPAEGAILKKDWFVPYSGGNPNNKPVHFYLDTAYTAKGDNDPSALLAFYEDGGNLFLVDCVAVRREFPELCKFIAIFTARNGYTLQSRIYIEPKASGLSVLQQLKRTTSLNVIADEPPRDSKVVRVTACSPVIEAGRVLVPEGAGWVPDFLDECAMFPNGAHDDRVDCLTGAIRVTLQRRRGLSTFITA
jgi:predicted phage terminase large subunit-like protein